MQITYVMTVIRDQQRAAVEITRTLDGRMARGILHTGMASVGYSAMLALAGRGHFRHITSEVTPERFETLTHGWPQWTADVREIVRAATAQMNGVGQPATRDELIHALEEAYTQLGKDKRWDISTLRLDIIGTALRNSGVVL
jgi:hypothetical protein